MLHERRGGWADPNVTLANLSGMARALVVRVVEGAEVRAFDLRGGLVSRIETSLGSIACDLVVVAPGPWARELWQMLELPDEIAVGDERRRAVSYEPRLQDDRARPVRRSRTPPRLREPVSLDVEAAGGMIWTQRCRMGDK